MSKEKNNNNELKKFLGNMNTPGNLPADDFEKEALEGFAMLDNEQEALDLKQNLDDKIHTKLFDTEKKSTAKTYWLTAAAGLILLIGFTIYFISGNITGISKNKDLAITSTESPDEIKPAVVPKEPAAETQTPALKLKEEKEEKTTSANNKTAAQPVVEEKQSEKIVAAPAKKLLLESKKSQASEAEISSANVSEDAQADFSRGVGAKQQEELAVAKDNTTDNTKGKMVNKDAEAAPVITQSGAVVMGGNTWSNNTSGAYSSNVPASASPAYSYSYAPPVTAGVFRMDSVYTCSYTGGENALHKDLSVKLKAKNIAQRFEATLYINENKVVTKAKLTKPYSLTKEQQVQVIEILKSLNRFTCPKKTKGLIEFKVVYKP